MTQPLEAEPVPAPATDAGSDHDPDAAGVADTPSENPPVPIRPPLVDLASAVLIVGGITALVGWLGAQIFNLGVAANAGLLPVIFVVLNVVAIALGIAIRRRRYWRLCINVVAVSILLYLTGLGNPIAMFYAALYVVVFYALFQHRAWFDGRDAPTSGAP